MVVSRSLHEIMEYIKIALLPILTCCAIPSACFSFYITLALNIVARYWSFRKLGTCFSALPFWVHVRCPGFSETPIWRFESSGVDERVQALFVGGVVSNWRFQGGCKALLCAVVLPEQMRQWSSHSPRSQRPQ